MLTHHDVLFGLGLPGLIGTVLFLLARGTRGNRLPTDLPARSTGATLGRDASPFALVFGYLTATNVLYGPPAIPPNEAPEWLYFGLLALAVLSAIYECSSAGAWHYYVPLSISGVMIPTIWLLVQPLAENHWSRRETAVWITGLTVAAVALPIAFARLYGRGRGAAGSISMVLVMAITALVLLLSGTKTYAQLAAGVAAALAPGALLVSFGRATPFSGHIAPSFVLLLGGLLLAGHQYASLTPLNALLLLVAPLGLWLVELRAVAHWRPGQRGLFGLGAVALPAIVATGLAAWKFLKETSTDYY